MEAIAIEKENAAAKVAGLSPETTAMSEPAVRRRFRSVLTARP
jgi:hypothetical protein